MIVGLTGKNCAGKGAVAEIFKEKGFVYYSLSDIIREELAKDSIEITRENLIRKGNELREEFGPSVLAERTIKKIEENKDYVIDSIRNIEEIKALRALKGFCLISIEAAVRIRFQRNLSRDRENAPDTLKKFKALEEKEFSSNPTQQQLLLCEKEADFIIENNSTLKALKEKVGALLRSLPQSFSAHQA